MGVRARRSRPSPEGAGAFGDVAGRTVPPPHPPPLPPRGEGEKKRRRPSPGSALRAATGHNRPPVQDGLIGEGNHVEI